MPLLLDDIKKKAVEIEYSPFFFSRKLTGTGTKKRGLLSQKNDPVNIDPNQAYTYDYHLDTPRTTYKSGSITTTGIPLYILNHSAENLIPTDTVPDRSDLHFIGTYETNLTKGDLYAEMHLYSIVISEDEEKDSDDKKKTEICYRLRVYMIPDKTNTTTTRADRTLHIQGIADQAPTANRFFDIFTTNPLFELNTIIDLAKCTINVDPDYQDIINEFSIYKNCIQRSEEWQTSIHHVLERLFQATSTSHISDPAIYDKHALNQVVLTLRHISSYPISLELYRKIYNLIVKYYHPNHAKIMCKENLNLLLADTLENLDQSKPDLIRLPQPQQPVQVPAHFSKEQVNAITSTDPLILVQAGAGTGKSTVILGRIDYMLGCGVDPNDIMVLSFTNAAANNILNRNPNVHSMTIASMIHSIYSANFPTHDLSNIDTIINSMDIFYPNDPFAREFKKKLKDIRTCNNQSFTSMNNFVEANYDHIIDILKTIRQTSLELEIIIAYQKISDFIEPDEIKSKYLIIDEVQDNSIFEFVYMLKYTQKNKQSLFIVGDCSQTLYEFRASNPKALNALEASGVFTAYQLQVNYRSNQEILDFANVALQNIEANQYANIQLQANILSPVTEKSFREKVTLMYCQLRKKRELKEALPSIFTTDIREYVDEKLKNKEKVAFIAYTRDLVYQMKDLIESMYPQAKIANLMPEKNYNDTLLSTFICKFWDQVKYAPSIHITKTISRMIIDKLDDLTFNAEKARDRVIYMLNQWQAENYNIILNWQQQYVGKLITLKQLMTYVRDTMLDYEKKNNAIKQSLLSMRNEENKKKEIVDAADLIFSTIHSAKGLEFQNVVVLYIDKKDMEEDQKRMYYVALTRAMQSEYILAFDTEVSPKITADYEFIIKGLKMKDEAIRKANQGGDTITVITGVNDDGDIQQVDVNPTLPPFQPIEEL